MVISMIWNGSSTVQVIYSTISAKKSKKEKLQAYYAFELYKNSH